MDWFLDAKGVVILRGDSGRLLPLIFTARPEPSLFWLDGHYSSGLTARGDLETPIVSELDAIPSRTVPDVVLVDDARLFGQGDFPAIEDIRKAVAARITTPTGPNSDGIVMATRSCPPARS